MNPKIAKAVSLVHSAKGFADARELAKQHEPEFPHSGCAAFLSSLLVNAGLEDLGVIVNAQALADTLEKRGWERVPVHLQAAGDVGVTRDENAVPGADHIYLVAARMDRDEMLIADNQQSFLHRRYASGKGKTPTDHFLRAPA